MFETFKNPKTGETHTATILTIICGALAFGVLVGVILERLPYEALIAFVLPIIGWGSMAMKNKNGGGK